MRQSIILIFAIILLLQYPATAQTTYSSFDDFKSAAESATSGDEIILADGEYTAKSITLKDIKGTEASPIILRSETIGGAILNSETYIDLRKCEYITFQGFVFNLSDESTTLKLQACNNIHITQNIFDGSGEPAYVDDDSRESSVWINIQGHYDDDITISHHNTVDHNIFKNKHTLGNMIRIDGTAETMVSHHDVIAYNHFKNMGPRAENEMEVIRVGWSAMSESDGFTTIEHNLFEECNGDPEIISVKCNKNTVSHNTFRRCQGTLSLRHGNESLVEGNFFLGENAEGTGGVRIYGSDHRIINNHFEGLTGTKWDAPITLTEGDAEEGNGSLTKHFRIERAIIAHNTLVNNDYGIEIGYDNQEKYSKPPRDVVMAYNIVSGSKNSLVKYINAPTNMLWLKNILHATDGASVGDGVSFETEEAIEQDPFLSLDETYNFHKASDQTPSFNPNTDIAGIIEMDIDGQTRSIPTNFGADHFTDTQVSHFPLSAKHVGPSQGEFLFIGTPNLSFPVKGGNSAISVSSNLDWTVTADQRWMSIDKNTGAAYDNITLTVEENTSGLVRSGTVTFTSTNISEGDNIVQKVIISQSDAEPPSLWISHDQINTNAEASIIEIRIESNISWTIAPGVNWISSFPSDGKDTSIVAISIEANAALTNRSGLITISDGTTQTKTISVTQGGSVGTEVKLNIVSAIASTEQEGNEAANTIDGKTDNRWSGEGDGAYITLDLGSIQNVSFLKVGVYKSDSRGTKFDIQTSSDGTNFTDALMDITSEVTQDTLILYDFDNIEARYVRIIGHGNTAGSSWNSFTEFEVWGWDSLTSIEKTNHNQISIFPNPSNGSFHINCQQKGTCGILSLNGQELLQLKLEKGENRISLDLETGIYFLRFEDMVRKFVIQ